MDYAEFTPTSALRDDARCYWMPRVGEEPHAPSADPAFPDGSPELILILADAFIAINAAGRGGAQPLAFLAGQITAPFHVRPSGRVDLVRIRLECCGRAGSRMT